jgi:fatty-acyl-CoA synthase
VNFNQSTLAFAGVIQSFPSIIMLNSIISKATAHPREILFTFVDGDVVRKLTYENIILESRRFAALIISKGAKSGDVVLISLRQGPDLVYSFLGAVMVGCIPSMMPYPTSKQDPNLFWSSHNALFKHLGGGYLITFEDNIAGVLANVEVNLLHLITPSELSSNLIEEDYFNWDPSQVCILQHSSGTTGLKKGVPLTFSMLEKQVKSYSKSINLNHDDVFVSWLPLYHDMGFITTFIIPLIYGNHSVIMSPFEWLITPQKLFTLIDDYKGSYIWLPNFAFSHLARSIREDFRADLSSVKAFINCSEPCKASTFDLFMKSFGHLAIRRSQLQVCYAMAESVFAVTQTEINRDVSVLYVSESALREKKSVSLSGNDLIPLLSVGKLVDGLNLNIIGGGQVGEISLKGDFIFSGYYKVTSDYCFNNNYYLTGDIGFIHENELYLLGRVKDTIIVLGKNFFAHEIEDVINIVEDIKPGRSVAIGIENSEVGSEDVIIVIETEDFSNTDFLRREVKHKLEGVLGLIPRKIVFVQHGWLVKSTSGKISRAENLKKYLREFYGKQ